MQATARVLPAYLLGNVSVCVGVREKESIVRVVRKLVPKSSAKINRTRQLGEHTGNLTQIAKVLEDVKARSLAIHDAIYRIPSVPFTIYSPNIGSTFWCWGNNVNERWFRGNSWGQFRVRYMQVIHLGQVYSATTIHVEHHLWYFNGLPEWRRVVREEELSINRSRSFQKIILFRLQRDWNFVFFA